MRPEDEMKRLQLETYFPFPPLYDDDDDDNGYLDEYEGKGMTE